MDWVAVSFVQRAQDMIDVEEFIEVTLMTNEGWPRAPKLIPKIEKPEASSRTGALSLPPEPSPQTRGQALEDLDAIMEHCQGLMVARGDLGVELGLHKAASPTPSPMSQLQPGRSLRRRRWWSSVAWRGAFGWSPRPK